MWKSISKLTQSDLEEAPVWELEGDLGSELVRPTSLVALDDYRNGPVHIAATRFVAASGKIFFGYCSPSEPSGLDYVLPVVLTTRGPFQLWRPTGLSPEDAQALASALSVTPDALFPMQVECLVPVGGIFYKGCVNAA